MNANAKMFLINIVGQFVIKVWVLGSILWIFSFFLGKWWFFLSETAIKYKVYAMRTGTVPFCIRKAFLYLWYGSIANLIGLNSIDHDLLWKKI